MAKRDEPKGLVSIPRQRQLRAELHPSPIRIKAQDRAAAGLRSDEKNRTGWFRILYEDMTIHLPTGWLRAAFIVWVVVILGLSCVCRPGAVHP